MEQQTLSNLDLSGQSLQDLMAALLANPEGAALLQKAQQQHAISQNPKPTTRFMINAKHGYPVPATEHNFQNADLKPFNGNVFPKNADEGLVWLNGGDDALLQYREQRDAYTAPAPRRAMRPVEPEPEPEQESFNIGRAGKEDLAIFAKEHLGSELDLTKTLPELRKEVRELYEEQVKA